MQWIKLNTTVFDDPRWIAISPDEVELAENTYVRLLVLAGKAEAGGRLMIFGNLAHTIDTIAIMVRRDKALIARGIEVLLELGFLVRQDGPVYAIAGWDRLQFLTDAKTRERDRERKRKRTPKSTPESLPESTVGSTPELCLEEEEDKEKEKEAEEDNNCNGVASLTSNAKKILQKWPVFYSETTVAAVVKALELGGEDYVVDNIIYCSKRARENPCKYLIDALTDDFSGFRGKSEVKALNVEAQHRSNEEKRNRQAEEDEEARQWRVSAEGQAACDKLKECGYVIPVL